MITWGALFDQRAANRSASASVVMPSMMPKVGQGRHPRVFYNTGHGHLGWTLSGATAAMVGQAVTEGLRGTRAPLSGGVAIPAE